MNLKITILISGLFFLMLPFVNCTGVSPEVTFTEVLTKSSSNQIADSGQPYDGKIYVVPSSDCTDGIEIRSRIVYASPTVAKLDRDNCEYIDPVTLDSSDLQTIPNNPDEIIYKNQIFKHAPSLAQGLTNFLGFGDATSVTYSFDFIGSPKFLQILLDTDNSFASGYNFSGDVGADYLFENGTLFIYSGNGGAWGWTPVGNSNMVISGTNVRWTVPRASIGSPARINAKARTSLGYSSGVLTQ